MRGLHSTLLRSTLLRSTLGLVLGLSMQACVASAQGSCKQDDIVAVMDQTGARLRELNADAQPRIRARLRELAGKRGWSDSDLETQGRAVLDDAQTRHFDERAAELFSTLDRLAEDESAGAACERLEQARATSKELVAVTAQRTKHALGRIEAELRPQQEQATTTQPTAPTSTLPPVREPAPSAPQQAPVAAAPPTSAQVPRAKAPAGAWETQTVRDGKRPSQTQPEASPTPAILPMPIPDPGALGFSPEEIRAAGRGLFGNISAALASVIDFAFQSYGKPTGYVLGDEGGAAFFAGLRYGEGRLVTKQQGERQVYWQGPSAGFDFGVAGSRVMFLVYNIDDHPELFQRFTGIDGSAYLVGGVGITLLKRGKIILAPIRTGLGLRVGANVGYLKFTPQHSFNPF